MHPPEFRCQEPMGPYLTCKERLRLTSAQVEKPADHTPGPNTISFQNTKQFESSALPLQHLCPPTRTLRFPSLTTR